jgi:hypothetical protein
MTGTLDDPRRTGPDLDPMAVRPSHLATWQRVMRATADRDAATLESLRGDDFVLELPQSGERIRGRDAVAAMEALDPDPVALDRPMRITSLGEDAFAVEAGVVQPDGLAWLVSRLDVHPDGRLHHVVRYVGAPFDAPSWRSPYVERYDPTDDVVESDIGTTDDDGIAEDVIRDVVTATGVGDFDRMLSLAAPDWQGTYPQSGERFTSVRAIADAHLAYPGGLPVERVVAVAGSPETWAVGPMSIPIRIAGRGACWFAEVALTYRDGSHWFQVTVNVTRGGRLWRDRFYYMESHPAPRWRAHLVERYHPRG